MAYYKFRKNDVLHNRIKAHPSSSYFIYDSSIYYNNVPALSGDFASNIPNVPTGYVSLFELNVDREESETGFIYPYTIKEDDDSVAVKTISADEFTDTILGEPLTGTYMMSASIAREFFPLNHGTTFTSNNAAKFVEKTLGQTDIEHAKAIKAQISGSRLKALEPVLDQNEIYSQHYAYSSSFGDKNSQPVNLVSIPSIIYGSEIKRGSVNIKYFLTGTLIGELQDERRNGELIQVGPAGSTGSGSIAGVVLYREGFLLMTGSWDISTSGTIEQKDTFGNVLAAETPKWNNWGVGAEDGTASGTNSDVAYLLDLAGTSYASTVTMFANTRKGQQNWSNNPTFISSSQESLIIAPVTGTYRYYERELELKNVVSSSYTSVTGSFEKTTYITKVGIYDKHKRLIAIASLANPLKKTNDRDLTIKLAIDI